MEISFPFSLTAVTTICCLRSALTTASLESATRTPVCSPCRPLPFHSNVGMTSSLAQKLCGTRPRATGGRRSLGLNRSGAPRDHFLQLVGIRRARQRRLQRDVLL